jgi:hypothetical protein
MIEQDHGAAALSGADGAHHARGPRTDDDYIAFALQNLFSLSKSRLLFPSKG